MERGRAGPGAHCARPDIHIVFLLPTELTERGALIVQKQNRPFCSPTETGFRGNTHTHTSWFQKASEKMCVEEFLATESTEPH